MKKIILASKSLSRLEILQNAGIEVQAIPSGVDEEALKEKFETAEAVAQALAAEKARTVSVAHPDALVIGADQILECDGKCFDKPQTVHHAIARLKYLSGKTHYLISGLALARGGEMIWSHLQRSTMVMRDFSDDFIAHYVAQEGDKICASVGAYLFEGRGIQLFSEIKGDYFAILGLPLLPLLSALRAYGALDDK